MIRKHVATFILNSTMSSEPAVAKDAVLKRSESLAEDTPKVQGYDFNQGVDYSKLFDSYVNTGFQATNLGLAMKEINRMVSLVNVNSLCNSFQAPNTGSWIAGPNRWRRRNWTAMKLTISFDGEASALSS